MSIAAHTHTANFTIIGNACFNDERLSFEALAIFTYLRSKPSDWTVRQTELARRFKAGRDRVRKAIKELLAAGYIRKVQERAAGRWSTADYDVLALPGAPKPDQPLPETPAPENRSLLSTDLLPSTDSTKEENIRHAANAADASEVDRGERAGETSTTTGRPLPSNRRSPGMYRQSEVESAIAWRELERQEGWGGTFGEDEMNRWHALLRKGYAADDIVDTAAAFLRKNPWIAPSLGDWLACFESYLHGDDGPVDDGPVLGASHHGVPTSEQGATAW